MRSQFAFRRRRRITWSRSAGLQRMKARRSDPLDPIEELHPDTHQEEFEGFLVRSVFRDDQRALGLVIKRWIDIVGALVGPLLLSPVLLAAASRFA